MTQSVYMLLCQRDVSMALLTIPRMLKFMQRDQDLFIMDDGSLAIGSIEKLTNLSPAIKVVTLKERDDFVLREIGDRPLCKKFRREVPLAFKLIDIPLLATYTSPRYTFTDCDIIYLQNCEQYFNRSVNTLLRTDAIKLSFRLRSGLLKYNWSIPLRFNSGYFSYDTVDFDLDFVEYFLGLPDVRNCPYLLEQSCWALLFGRAGQAYCPSDNQFICREKLEGPADDMLAIHLIGNLKEKVNQWSNYSAFGPTAPAPEFEVSRNVSLQDWAKKSIHRILHAL